MALAREAKKQSSFPLGRSSRSLSNPKNKIKYGANTNHQKLCGGVNARQANSRLATKATTSTARRDVFACLSLPDVHTDRADQTSVVRRATRGLGTTPSQEVQSRKHVWCSGERGEWSRPALEQRVCPQHLKPLNFVGALLSCLSCWWPLV
jgi:hypothetical protein